MTHSSHLDLRLLFEALDPFLEGFYPPCCDDPNCANNRLRQVIEAISQRNGIPLPSNLIAAAFIEWHLAPGHSPSDLGLLPEFLRVDDQRPAIEQFNERYAHGGGWRPIEGFVYNTSNGNLAYPGDPLMKPFASCEMPHCPEVITVYSHSFVAVYNKSTGEVSVARLD